MVFERFRRKSADAPLPVRLTAADVAALYARFDAGIDRKTDALMAAAGMQDDTLRTQVRTLVLNVTRNRIEGEYPDEKLVTLIRTGGSALADAVTASTQLQDAEEKRAQMVEDARKRRTFPSSDIKSGAVAFSPEQENAIAFAARARTEHPRAAAFFGDETRIFYRLPQTPSETEARIATRIGQDGYRIADYARGHATRDGKQMVRIGKLLAGMQEDALRTAFEHDSARVSDKMVMVVSRDAQDIARMSTNRNWGSCTSAVGAAFFYVAEDIEQGAIIAYLVSEKDPHIIAPLGRCVLKPYAYLTPQEEAREAISNLQPQGLLLAAYAAFAKQDDAMKGARAFVPQKTYGLANDGFTAAITAVTCALNTDLRGRFTVPNRLYADGPQSVKLKR